MTSKKYQPLGLEWNKPITNREAKMQLARAVADGVCPGEVVGVGSGSTSFLTVLALGERVASEQLEVSVVPTSIEMELACHAVGLAVLSDVPGQIDRCFDGADEVDPQGRLIKGRGGALYREKLVFAATRTRIIVADKSKDVDRLGSKFPVPIEVKPQWLRLAYDLLHQMDSVREVGLRMGQAKDGPVITESGNVLLDAWFNQINSEDEIALNSIPGVVCTGIFSGFAFQRISD
ncbi:MAG: ribose 5-phosphate isomerase A [Pirellulales bacterium]